MYLEKIKSLISLELKYSYRPKVFYSLVLLIFMQVFLGYRNLDYQQALIITERFIPLLGIIFIGAVFNMELDNNILDILRVRPINIRLFYYLRIGINIVMESLIILIIMLVLKKGGSQISFRTYLATSLAISILLGAINLLLTALTGGKIYALALVLAYYLLNWFESYETLKSLYLFRLSAGLAPGNIFLWALALLFLVLAVEFFVGWSK